MTRFVIDPPTLVRLARERIDVSPDHRLVAPNSLRSGALEILLGEVRSGALTDREALGLHDRITEVKVRLLGDRVSRRAAWDIAREHDWDTLAMAEYLAVAQLQADALVTVDPGLARLAAGVVPVARLADLVD